MSRTLPSSPSVHLDGISYDGLAAAIRECEALLAWLPTQMPIPMDPAPVYADLGAYRAEARRRAALSTPH